MDGCTPQFPRDESVVPFRHRPRLRLRGGGWGGGNSVLPGNTRTPRPCPGRQGGCPQKEQAQQRHPCGSRHRRQVGGWSWGGGGCRHFSGGGQPKGRCGRKSELGRPPAVCVPPDCDVGDRCLFPLGEVVPGREAAEAWDRASVRAGTSPGCVSMTAQQQVSPHPGAPGKGMLGGEGGAGRAGKAGFPRGVWGGGGVGVG